jgi:hypothetical protein
MFTFETARRTLDANGVPLGQRYRTHDGRWCDSTGTFLVGELERLDPTLHLPLVDVTWARDIDLREDVTLADEFTAFAQQTVASAGSLGTGHGVGTGKAWIGKTTTQITGVDLDINKQALPLTLWALELKYTIPELESAIRLGRPIDQGKIDAINLKHQMDIDEQVYIGDLSLSQPGLLTNPRVMRTNFPASAQSGGGTQWRNKTPDEVLADFNQALTTTWAASGWSTMSNRIGIPPEQFGYIATAKVATQAGNMSIKRYIEENNVSVSNGSGSLTIVPIKWLTGAGEGGVLGQPHTVDRMIVYTKAYDRVRFPMTLLQRTPLQYEGIYHKATYYCRLGVVEWVYPETASYWDGL